MTRLQLRLKATEIVSAWTPSVVFGVFYSWQAPPCYAQQTPDDLEKLARNPVG